MLATHDERHLRAECTEHVSELHARDTRTDHDEVVGHLGRRIRLARRQNALPIHSRPIWDTGSTACGDQNRVGFNCFLASIVGVRHTYRVGAEQPTMATNHSHVLTSKQIRYGISKSLLNRRKPFTQRTEVEASFGFEAHDPRSGNFRKFTASCDHRLAGDAIPEVRGPTDNIAFDHGDFCT